MSKKVEIIVIILIFVSLKVSKAATYYTDQIAQAHAEILKLEFAKADSLIKAEMLVHPNNVYVPYLRSIQWCIKAYFDAKPSDYDAFVKTSDKTIELLEKEHSDEALLMQANLRLFQSMTHYNWDHAFAYVSSLISGKKAIDQVKSRDGEYLKIKAAYEVIGGSVPSQYKRIASWFNIKGTPTSGVKWIEHYVNTQKHDGAHFLEGMIFKHFIYHLLDIEESKDINAYLSHPLLFYIHLRTSKLGAKQKIKQIETYSHQRGKQPQYYIYLKALYQLQLQQPEGLNTMQVFIQTHKGSSFMASAYHDILLYHCSQGHIDDVKALKIKIKSLPKPIFPSDKKVFEQIESIETCTQQMTKARLLFDGGEYVSSMAVMNQINTSKLTKPGEKLEYQYRMARLYEKTNQTKMAIAWYKKVSESTQTTYYYPSYASYSVAQIYRALNKPDSAGYYYRKALQVNDSEYKSGIEIKANYAISQLK